MPTGKYEHKELSNETKLKIGIALKGIKKHPLSDETKMKISNSKKGVVSYRKGLSMEMEFGEERTKEIKEKNRLAHLNIIISKETREKIRVANLGKKKGPMSKEGRENLSIAHIGKQTGKDNPFFGREHTDCSREKMRLSRINYIEEQKLQGLPLIPCIGKLEKPILDNLEICFNYKILRQYKVRGWFLDGYCQALNLAIEIDEPYHRRRLEKDALKEQEVKEALGCQFLRIAMRN